MAADRSQPTGLRHPASPGAFFLRCLSSLCGYVNLLVVVVAVGVGVRVCVCDRVGLPRTFLVFRAMLETEHITLIPVQSPATINTPQD